MENTQKHYSSKLPDCAIEGPENNATQLWIQNILLLYKFVSAWLIILLTSHFLQINACTKSSLPTKLQTKFQYISSLNALYIDYLIISLIALVQNIEIHEVWKCLHNQRHLQTINIMKANQPCTEQENN